ncbi:class I SAM-dependent methyltransferase [Capilliphycus salinus ALCB114379]|uniref:class I SAM-dependent methyltransferase n=1 Tax=Capilliphycus salinus TaxID=2768948 RepID=UPI0039A647A1
MSVRKDTIFQQFLAPLFENFLIDGEALKQFKQSINWEKESDRLTNPSVTYPDYYQSQNFHGIKGGYLNPEAPVSYDPITQHVLPPNETIVRQGLIDRIRVKPRRILDLGCGTGSTTLLLKKAFPNAEAIAVDLSPYMLVAAELKAKKAGLDIQFRHSNAEATGFPDQSFDLVTASLLFHETPPEVAQTILNESFRLLRVGGEVIVLDGNQKALRQTEWLTEIFEEPYIKAYAAASVDKWMTKAGFAEVQTDDWWWVHQISRGIKPIVKNTSTSASSQTRVSYNNPTNDHSAGLPAPA